MKMKLSIFIILLMLLSSAFTQGVEKVGYSGYKFLSIPLDARNTALGNSMITDAKGANAIFVNPALLNQSSQVSVYVNQIDYLLDMTYSAAAVSYRFGSFGVVGFHLAGFSSGDIKQTTLSMLNGVPVFENPNNTFEYTAFNVGLSYARMLTDRFGFGGTFSYVTENLTDGLPDDNQTKNVTFNIGTIYYPNFENFKSLRMAMSLYNFSPETNVSGSFDDFNNGEVYETREYQNFPLPLSFRFGISFDAFRNEENYVMLSTMIEHPNDNHERFGFGSEYGFKDLAYLRGGYIANDDSRSFSGGLGLKLKVSSKYILNFDYSYVDYGLLENVQYFSFNVSW
ncbi:MAG: hypothetical protein Kow00108_19380 [Calditrichia bacterium]